MRSTLATRLVAGIMSLMLVVTIVELGSAQDQPAQPEPYGITYIQVKPGMSVEFEAFVKNIFFIGIQSGKMSGDFYIITFCTIKI